ncbi:MAG: VWA domain-containing protein [Deltaproteobacteria bacterium]|nr:VWA domain-containing protein [Deltaproteobacteria bacterium]
MKSEGRVFGSMRCSVYSAGFCLLFLLLYCSAENDRQSGTWKEDGSIVTDVVSGGTRNTENDPYGSSARGGSVNTPTGGSEAVGTDDRESGVADACASISREAEKVEITVTRPVSLYVMLDQSRSMNESSGASTKWEVAVDSINAFVNDPASAELEIALQYFPLLGGACTGEGYSTPEVSMGMLPDHSAAISDSLALHAPGMVGGGGRTGGGGGGTPIEGALNGVTAFCARYKQDTSINPEGRNCVAVLVTDGLPNGCNEDPAVLAGIARAVYANDSVRTFAIGMTGADFSLLDQIALEGQGDCTPDATDPGWACNVSTGNITFLDALNLIRDTVTDVQIKALECEWEIPAPPEGEQFDQDKVNVEFSTTGLDTDKQVFGRVEGEQQCGNKLGWYYDNPDNPTRIIACEQACSTIQSSETGTINILLGCGTLLLI